MVRRQFVGEDGVEPRLGFVQPAAIEQGAQERTSGVDSHRGGECCQRRFRRAGVSGQQQGSSSCNPDRGPVQHFHPAARVRLRALGGAEIAAAFVDPRCRPIFQAEATQFGRGAAKHREFLGQRTTRALDGASWPSHSSCQSVPDQQRSSKTAGGGDGRAVTAKLDQYQPRQQRGDDTPGRGKPDEVRFDGGDIADHPRGRLTGAHGKRAGRRLCRECPEQRRANAGKCAQCRIVARQTFAIARAGTDDRQQADRGTGQHVVERLYRDQAGRAGNRSAGDEPARQAKQRDRRRGHQGGAERSPSQEPALSATLRGKQRLQGAAHAGWPMSTI